MLASIYNAATAHLFGSIIRRLEEEGAETKAAAEAEMKADAEAKREEANEFYRAKCASAVRLYKDMRLAANKLMKSAEAESEAKRASAEKLYQDMVVANRRVADCVAEAKEFCSDLRSNAAWDAQVTFAKCKEECDKRMAKVSQMEKSAMERASVTRRSPRKPVLVKTETETTACDGTTETQKRDAHPEALHVKNMFKRAREQEVADKAVSEFLARAAASE